LLRLRLLVNRGTESISQLHKKTRARHGHVWWAAQDSHLRLSDNKAALGAAGA